MIKAEHLVKYFGPKLAVNDVSFTVGRGEVLGFLGPNGAGKSTSMRMITGFFAPSAGTVTIDGHDIVNDSIAAKACIGYLPENAPAYPEMTVQRFLNFMAAVRGLRGRAATEAVEKVIETCFLQSVRRQPIETLSKGFRHRTCFAQAILHDPPALVLDEPTDGLDPNQKHEMRNLIKRMGRSKAIILSTHILEEVDAVCSRVIIIDRGRLVFNGTPADLRGKSDLAGAVTARFLGQSANTVREAFRDQAAVARVVTISDEDGAAVLRFYPRGEAAGPPNLARLVAESAKSRGWLVDQLRTEEGALDAVFHALTASDTGAKEKEVAA
ncbi:MAG: putative ABC transporter ATP-binding protein YbhF [Lentisphaerae bacterium ADurb.BinA184]|nr:MAG: putative ABC transporter ATP-binding protein YbhF [Lentisphaerae bacterium ADurb.BinA184]